MVRDTIPYMHHAVKNGKEILIEGAQSNVLDIDFGINALFRRHYLARKHYHHYNFTTL